MSTEPSRMMGLKARCPAALEGSQEFTVHPALPLYLPGEPVQLEVA
jgi:hypothetical protein